MNGSFDIANLGGTGSVQAVAEMSGTLSFQIVNTNYEKLDNLPTINGVLVKGDLTSSDLKIERGYDAYVDPDDPEHLILTL